MIAVIISSGLIVLLVSLARFGFERDKTVLIANVYGHDYWREFVKLVADDATRTWNVLLLVRLKKLLVATMTMLEVSMVK